MKVTREQILRAIKILEQSASLDVVNYIKKASLEYQKLEKANSELLQLVAYVKMDELTPQLKTLVRKLF